MKVTKIGVVSKEGRKDAETVASSLADLLVSEGFRVLTAGSLKLESTEYVATIKEIGESRADIVASVGGDGTILRVIRGLDAEIPVLGVNVGGRGILAETRPEDLKAAVKRLSDGDFVLDWRIRLVASSEGVCFPPAANEIYLDRKTPIGTPTYTIKTDESMVFQQRMDGVMISTPTGSTGHSYGHGGPILQENMEAVLITPVCPINKFPPIVIPLQPFFVSSSVYTNLIVDGQEVFSIRQDAEVKVEPYSKKAVFVRFNRKTLRQLNNLGFR